METHDDRKPSFLVYVAAVSALMGAMCMGAVLGWSSPSLSNMAKNGSEPLLTVEDKEVKSWIGSCVTLGALVGGLICGVIIEYLGRKKSLIFLGIPFTIGWILICVAKSYALIITGRTITGFCSGLICSFAPTYVIELSTPKIRGLLGAGFQVFVVVGILYMDIFGILVEKWNWLAVVGLVPGAVMSVAMFFMPESPAWLMRKYGRSAQVVDALRRLRSDDSDIEAELKELEDRAEKQRSQSGFSLDQLKRRDVYMPFIIAMCLMFFQQYSGINAVLFYTTDIFKDAGSSMDGNLATIIVTTSMVVATVAGSLVIDRLGRKMLLITSGTGHVISLAVLGYYYLKNQDETTTVSTSTSTTVATIINTTVMTTAEAITDTKSGDWGWVPIACLVVFVITFSLGFGPIPWMIVGEITPGSVIGVISSIATAFNWTCAFSVTKEFEEMENALTKYGTFWMFAGFSALSVVFTVLVVPETKGKSIEQIQNYFLGGRSYSDTSVDSYNPKYNSNNNNGSVNNKNVTTI